MRVHWHWWQLGGRQDSFSSCSCSSCHSCWWWRESQEPLLSYVSPLASDYYYAGSLDSPATALPHSALTPLHNVVQMTWKINDTKVHVTLFYLNNKSQKIEIGDRWYASIVLKILNLWHNVNKSEAGCTWPWLHYLSLLVTRVQPRSAQCSRLNFLFGVSSQIYLQLFIRRYSYFQLLETRVLVHWSWHQGAEIMLWSYDPNLLKLQRT